VAEAAGWSKETDRCDTDSPSWSAGVEALVNSTSGHRNTASGQCALLSNTGGSNNTAIGYKAGANATTGNYNVYLGADVLGTASEWNTMRLGLPYDSGTFAGQARTSGGLGAAARAEGEASATVVALRRQVEQSQATDAELRGRLARLEPQLQALAAAPSRR
jgi:hypothetical protein